MHQIDPDYVGVRAGARMLRVSTGAFYRVVVAARVRTLPLPGCAIRYSVADLRRIDAEAGGVARQGGRPGGHGEARPSRIPPT